MSDPTQNPPPSLASPTPPPARGLNRFAVGAALAAVTILFAILAFLATSQKPQPPVIKETRETKPAAPEFLNNPPRRSPGDDQQVDPRLAQLLSHPPATSSGPFGLRTVPPQMETPTPPPVLPTGDSTPTPAPPSNSSAATAEEPPPGAYRPYYPGVRVTRLESVTPPQRPQSWEAAFKSSLLAGGGSPAPAPSPGSTPPSSLRPEDLFPLVTRANDVRPGDPPVVSPPAPQAKTPSPVSRASAQGAGAIVPAGTVINAILLTAINTQHPGDVTAQISSDVLDSRGRVLLPRGSRLLGSYKDQVALGDSRVAIAWTRLQLRGRTVELPNLASAAPDGSAGQPGSVNNHTGLVFGRAVLLSLVSAGAQLGQPRRTRSDVQFSNGEIVAGAATQEMTTTANEYLRKAVSVTPTIEVPAGAPITVVLSSDLSLPIEE